MVVSQTYLPEFVVEQVALHLLESLGWVNPQRPEIAPRELRVKDAERFV